MTAREAALKALEAFRRGQLPEIYIDSLKLEPRESALARRICASVLTNSILLDYWIGQHISRPLEKIHPRMLDVLRLSAAQIAFFDRIPSRAAVDEGVKLARNYVNNAASGMANAVLRKIASEGHPPKPEAMNKIEYLSILYSCPVELSEYYVNTYGETIAEEILRAQNEEPPVFARVNSLKENAEELLKKIEGVSEHPWLCGTLELRGSGGVEKLDEFREGLFFVQDPAATLAVLAAGIRPNMRVLDACASPGGKSFAAALEMRGKGSITARDISEKKLQPIQESAARLGIEIICTEIKDAARDYPGTGYDVVIADAPCSGYGTVRKKPEIRYKKLRSVAQMPEKQLAILNNLADAVRPGGVLVYSTCTLIKAENEGVTGEFLKVRTDFTEEEFVLPKVGKCDGHVTLVPGEYGTDGFYICRMRKKT